MEDIALIKELDYQKKIMVIDKLFNIDNLYDLAKSVIDGRVEILKSESQTEQRIVIKQL